MTVAAVTAFLWWLWAQIVAIAVPILATFGSWIAAGAALVFGFLFSPSVRKYTIGAACLVLFLAVVWLNGYLVGKSHVVKATDICADPGFHQIILKGKNDKSAIAAARGHNDLGERLGCWSNSNIR